jgi:nitrogen fixation protein FixH
MTAEQPDTKRSMIPMAFFAFFAVVLSANAVMVYFAVQSWTGLEYSGYYLKGLRYNDTLAAVAHQEARGWSGEISVVEHGRRRIEFAVTLQDRNGNALTGARAVAAFRRPTHAGHDFRVALEPVGIGRYGRTVTLPLAGQWQVQVELERGGEIHKLAQRIVVR